MTSKSELHRLIDELPGGELEPVRRLQERVLSPTKPGGVTVPMHKGKELRLATLASILEEAGLSVDDLRRLL